MVDYRGYITLNESQMEQFYSNKTLDVPVNENQYIIISPNEIYCYQNYEFRKVGFDYIESQWTGLIKPRDEYQRIATDMLNDRKSKVKVVRGVYGSGRLFATV